MSRKTRKDSFARSIPQEEFLQAVTREAKVGVGVVPLAKLGTPVEPRSTVARIEVRFVHTERFSNPSEAILNRDPSHLDTSTHPGGESLPFAVQRIQ